MQVDMQGIFSGTWSQGCGANIITNLHVVSAAHCFAGWTYLGPQYRRIRAGSSLRNTGGVIVYIVSEHNHPSYGTLGYDGDVSVVRLATPLTFSPVIQAIPIPSQGSQLTDNVPVVHAGWGTTIAGVSASVSPVLLETTIYTVNNQLCANRYASLNNP
ncbi:trypsin-like serine protease, partial [Enterobacter hormaechei]|uniref:trypsin-like serine protease n=1 Tax=Enterobacter hormaechei TaxID=158836 RepID=UPI001F11E1B9